MHTNMCLVLCCVFYVCFLSLQWRGWRWNSRHGWLVDSLELWTLHYTPGREGRECGQALVITRFLGIVLDLQPNPLQLPLTLGLNEMIPQLAQHFRSRLTINVLFNSSLDQSLKYSSTSSPAIGRRLQFG